MFMVIVPGTYSIFLALMSRIVSRLELLKRLAEHEPESVDIPDSDRKNVLHIASATGATDIVKYLLTTKVC